ncbi:MAG: DNA gyrase subunit A [Gemmataceae bacterium]
MRRRFQFELEQLRRRIHILEGFRLIFNALDEAIRLIRTSTGKADAAEKLIATFQLDEDQAAAVLESQLYRIAQMEIRKILDELKEKIARAKEIEAILASEPRLWGVVKNEIGEVGEKYGKDRRRTRMGSSDDEVDFDPEAYIVRENTNVVLTRDGWIKRVGRLTSVETTRVREGDEVVAVAPGSTVDHVVSSPRTAPPTPCGWSTCRPVLAMATRSPSSSGWPIRCASCAISTDERFTAADTASANRRTRRVRMFSLPPPRGSKSARRWPHSAPRRPRSAGATSGWPRATG